ncbi:predicted protein [Naegleria gruberi]|uniref:Predicted protein n=1 Tax=Naegleria gruberi TaxID=5762 RepID=D2V299_NAEGR|nr:uncharacterized protein NAEGRDRAFT_62928 [Naegleria gruberi]EFC48864.1 predicted protein [Naegleria gruberi]|eukprot:XP_002681608.1 predicted protein [Naegleria gruberi strain NEG-M]
MGHQDKTSSDAHDEDDTLGQSKTVREIMTEKLKDVKGILTACIGRVNVVDREKERTMKEKENLRSQALERYATELQVELDTIRFEFERKNMLVEELKRQSLDRKKDQDTIKTLRECLEFKDAEMRELQSQLASNSLIGYNSEAAKSRMQNLIATLMKDTEECKRRNMESQHRLEKRLLEWQQVKEENKKLRFRVSDLQETIHRQMNDLHISLMHKEQKLNAWKSKVAELASDNNEMRYRAAGFLLSLVSEQDNRDTELLLKYEETKRNLHFSQMENNELRLEIQNLKDVLQYTDVHTTKQTMDMLRDKIHQMEIECSVDRVLEYQNTITNLSSKVSEYERMQGLYIQEFSRLKKLNTKFNEGACIGTLERKIQLYEKKIESLEKHIDQAFVERESAISPILPSSQMQLLNPSNPLSAIQRVELKETTPNIIPKPLSS